MSVFDRLSGKEIPTPADPKIAELEKEIEGLKDVITQQAEMLNDLNKYKEDDRLRLENMEKSLSELMSKLSKLLS